MTEPTPLTAPEQPASGRPLTPPEPFASRGPLAPRLPPDAAVKVIGLGGVGSVVARYGAVFLASLGTPARLVLIDGDAFEPSNATRMLFAGPGKKAAVLRDELVARFGESLLSIAAVEEYVSAANAPRLLRDGDTVLLAVDNHATRRLVSDFCAERLADVCLISAGNDGIGVDGGGRARRGTFGNCQIYLRRDGADVTPSLTEYHPEIRDPADRLPTETDADCVTLAVSTPQILFANLMAACSMMNALWLSLCGALHYHEICFDVADGLMRPLPALPATRSSVGS